MYANLQGSISCAVLGYAGYYTSMAMFAWMTVRQDDLNSFTYYLPGDLL